MKTTGRAATTTTTARPKPVFIRRPNCCCLLFVLPLSLSLSCSRSSLLPPNFFFASCHHHRHSGHFTLFSTQLPPCFTLRHTAASPLNCGRCEIYLYVNLRNLLRCSSQASRALRPAVVLVGKEKKWNPRLRPNTREIRNNRNILHTVRFSNTGGTAFTGKFTFPDAHFSPRNGHTRCLHPLQWFGKPSKHSISTAETGCGPKKH